MKNKPPVLSAEGKLREKLISSGSILSSAPGKRKSQHPADIRRRDEPHVGLSQQAKSLGLIQNLQKCQNQIGEIAKK